jgi:hypothetical protein
MDRDSTNWDLVEKGWLGVEWIIRSNDIKNADKTLKDLYGEQIAPNWNGERLFNEGVLMMASYLLFVYPIERDFDKIDPTSLEFSDFTILTDVLNQFQSDKLLFLKRIRNSIAHARYNIKNNVITMSDFNQQHTNNIEFSIGLVNFGIFIQKFAVELRKVSRKK